MDIPFDLLLMVASFYTKQRMKLLDWIPINKLEWNGLSENPNAIQLLEKYPTMIRWTWLSGNRNLLHALHLLEKYPDKINWKYLSENPNALHIIEKNLDKIVWYNLSLNLDKSLRDTSFRKIS